MKWLAQLSEFDYTIHYRSGPKNKPADFLSWLPSSKAVQAVTSVAAVTWACCALGVGNLRMEQHRDPVANTVIRVVEETKCVDNIAKAMLTPVKQLLRLCSIESSGGCLVSLADTNKYFVPSPVRMTVLEQCHDSVTGGHLSFMKTLGKVSQRFFWPDMRADVDNWVKSCEYA